MEEGRKEQNVRAAIGTYLCDLDEDTVMREEEKAHLD